MGVTASQITSLTFVHSTVYSGTDQRKHPSSASLALVLGIYRWSANSPHKWPETRKMFPFWWHHHVKVQFCIWWYMAFLMIMMLDPTGTNRRKLQAVSSDVVFYIGISLKQRNRITRRKSFWAMHVIYPHTYTKNTRSLWMFLIAAKIWSG